MSLRSTLAVVIIAFASPHAFAEEAGAPDAESFLRPGYSFPLRQNEDWSALSAFDPNQTGDYADPIKYIPLDDDGDVWMSFGGHARTRLEAWDDFNFGAPAGTDHDDVFLLTRVMAHVDLHIGEHLRFFAEGKSALSTERDLPGGRRTLDADELDLQQLFGDLIVPLDGDATLTLRGGRQMLLFGKQRLVSPLPWSNTMRTWDGVSAILEVGGWNIHGFWTQFVPVQKFHFNDADRQTQFYGVYATGDCPLLGKMDLYYLGLDRDDPITFNGTTGAETRHTVGGRLFGKCGDSGFDYDIEGAYQFGEVGSADINAFMIATEIGYAFSDSPWSPRLFGGFDYATGDDSAGGDVETFNHLFPLGHAYFGIMDFVGRQNIVDFSGGITVKPHEKVTATLTGHYFLRADTDDALYNAGGGVVRPGAAGNDREVGAEIDLVVTWKIYRHLTAQVGYGHFFAGDFIDEAGPDDDMDFGYLQLQYLF